MVGGTRPPPRPRVGISGHQGLSTNLIAYVTNEIRAYLAPLGPVTGIASLAEGADQLFAKCVLDLHGRIEVVLPSAGYEGTFLHEASRTEYKRLLSLADRVTTLNFAAPTEEAYLAAGKAVADSCDVLLAVWDSMPARGRGGTADIVEHARGVGRTTIIVWPAGVLRD